MILSDLGQRLLNDALLDKFAAEFEVVLPGECGQVLYDCLVEWRELYVALLSSHILEVTKALLQLLFKVGRELHL